MKQTIARKLLAWMGWSLEGAKPVHERYVLIAAPHTSNWDFPLMLLFAAAFDIKIQWMAKHSLFRPPMGWVMRGLGGLPINRKSSNGVVCAMAEALTKARELVLVVPSEGTRDRVEYWKSGFYHIARQANVPIVPSMLDFGRKRGGFGAGIMPTGDVKLDMDYFRDFYAEAKGKFPEKMGPIRLREEDPVEEHTPPCAAA
ncbi:acyltransferase [Halioglobus sp. HI00S01]|uniref:1-acyl-sn-glycerol-3-phosphate acyltransferase n=1 Tax=Halioglobus sp. HI00S01 TaxID=1822214 RepID=UPI0007C2843D|nr:1-acyl-sn-glycerol-3-phosphate acyltransferase [Halioglobus sp. HI00S01]KZX58762.1 acyltransferase [Halioglobus sp. HI00S01]